MKKNQPHLPEGGVVLSEEWHEYFNALVRDMTAAGSIPKSEARRRILKLVELCTNDISQEAFKKGREAGMREAMEKLDQLPAWPDPVKDLDNGISHMFDSGLVTQYRHDKEKHDQEMRELRASLESLIQDK